MPNQNAIERTLRLVLDLLVKKDYAELERMTHGIRLSAAELEEGVRDYGRTIAQPPPDAFGQVDVVPIRGAVPSAYSVRFRLFTLEEGESDLELQATLIDKPEQEIMGVELDNIIVA